MTDRPDENDFEHTTQIVLRGSAFLFRYLHIIIHVDDALTINQEVICYVWDSDNDPDVDRLSVSPVLPLVIP